MATDCLVYGQRGPEPANMACRQYRPILGYKTPEEGHTMSPWVKVAFTKGDDLGVITVGNLSSPTTNPQHVAVIKSFEYGFTDGQSVKVVIQDQQGGSFHTFMTHCVKQYACLGKGAANVQMKFSFGWTKSGCVTEFSPSSSPCYFLLMDSIETSYAEGKFTFEIRGHDLGTRMQEGNDDRIFGGDGDKAVPIKEAIEELLMNKSNPDKGPKPIVASVRILTWNNGKEEPAKFKVPDRNKNYYNGPEGKYECKGRTKLQTLIEWLKFAPSINDRGWIPAYNPLVDGGEIIIWEDINLCKNQPDQHWDMNNIGAYIVNGSKFSPVIEFAPKIKWDFSRLSNGGGAIGEQGVNAMGEEGGKNPGGPCLTIGRENNPGAGHTTNTNPSENTTNNSAKGEDVKDAAAANAAARKALRLTTEAIGADLTVIGDPSIDPLHHGNSQKTCSIILINPYFITPNGNGCGDWTDMLAQSPCNEILSSKAWRINNVTHKIEGGNFTTTLGLWLDGPGEDLDANANLGGSNLGWKPPPC